VIAAAGWLVHAAGARYAAQAQIAEPAPGGQLPLFDDDEAGED